MKTTKNIRIAIVAGMFQKEITKHLIAHCVQTLKKNGLTDGQITIVKVPGSLEIPLAARLLAKKKSYDAIIALGAIHKGKTLHFEQVANECIRGCMNVSWEYEIPVIYEVLAVYDIQDGLERATRTKENRGVEAALAALAMIKTMQDVATD